MGPLKSRYVIPAPTIDTTAVSATENARTAAKMPVISGERGCRGFSALIRPGLSRTVEKNHTMPIGAVASAYWPITSIP